MIEGINGVSSYAADIDRANIIVHGLSLFMLFVVLGAMFIFAYKYSEKRARPEDTKNIKHYLPIEFAWTIIPTIFMMIMFYYGLEALKAQRTIPENAMIVKVEGKKWSWSFEYSNGKKTDILYLPVHTDVVLEMTAPIGDVTHNFYVPAFRNKEDVVPGKITKTWFNINRLGTYDIECAEYCGTRHAYMLSKIVAMSKNKFDKWFNSDSLEPTRKVKLDPKGLVVLKQNGCISCHSLEPIKLVGPSFKGIYNREVKVIDSNKNLVTMISDEAYLKDAILKPNKEIVDGYMANVMPSYENVISEDDINEMINYLKELK
ncbi:MAG: Cytochrome c oxidase polypeptide II (EC [uncultured Campylobacterales bacterium]|uniref:Cytochrome c oxidase subunit 2 n=1 Tax=uncultured Campylobacterales bacterium TaxID=352960 RepID=A0A6S6T9L1_9BACT|nr:MAG: Cytochrome c oxidase polypeptide II (EC [uncultured Campylobacterales bacterium]